MALALNKILISGLTGNTAGAYSQNQNVTVLNGGNTVLTAGLYIIPATTNVQVMMQTAVNTWTNVNSTAVGGVFFSDGVNVRLTNRDVLNVANITMITVNGGTNVTGQFNI